MKRKTIVVLTIAALLLGGCQTASYKATSQLAGTSWKASDSGTNPKGENFPELQFGADLAPSGMGNVRVSSKKIALFQVINGQLVMRYNYLHGRNRTFDFDMTDDALTLKALSPDGKPLGEQSFEREK